jgi:hypothetical protein
MALKGPDSESPGREPWVSKQHAISPERAEQFVPPFQGYFLIP